LTRDYNAMLPLMLATVLADLLARTLVPHSIMTEKLARRGVMVPAAFHADPLRTTPVSYVMTRDVVTVPNDADAASVAVAVQRSGHSALPVVDDAGHLVGMVSAVDLIERQLDPGTPITEIATNDLVTVAPTDTLHTSLDLMVDESVDHLPVVDHGRLVGICTRGDILQARIRQLDHEHPEHGWLRRRRAAVNGDRAGSHVGA
jgi:CBS domain-containing protein